MSSQDSAGWLLGTTAFVASAVLSGLVRRYALAHSLLDLPNERSLHSVPTPRGGGLAIALVVLVGLVVLAATGALAPQWAIGLVGGGALVAWVGWLDDRRGLPASGRALVHVAAAVWTVWWLGGMPRLTIGAETVHLGLGGGLLAVLGVVWATNLYNFMDGIDGLAATEAVTVGLVGAVLLAGRSPALALVAILLASAAGGFLCWNWPPARLFMGDVGSGFLGFLFGGLAVASEQAQALPSLLWLVLLGSFFADATITLLRRMIRGERWHTPHRSHAYQRAVEAGWSHLRVTVTMAFLSVGLGLLGSLAVASPGRLGLVLALAAAALGALYLVVEWCRPMR
jgi:Fuc2NAc and GlcNAc transferase